MKPSDKAYLENAKKAITTAFSKIHLDQKQATKAILMELYNINEKLDLIVNKEFLAESLKTRLDNIEKTPKTEPSP